MPTTNKLKFPDEIASPTKVSHVKKGPFLFAPESHKFGKYTDKSISYFKKIVYKKFKEKYNIDLNDIGEFAGKGELGSAWQFGNNKIIKFTKDKSEVANSAKIMGKNLPHVINIDRVFVWPRFINLKDKNGNTLKFDIHGSGNFLGMIIQEKITPVEEIDILEGWQMFAFADETEEYNKKVGKNVLGKYENLGHMVHEFMYNRMTIKYMKQYLTLSTKVTGMLDDNVAKEHGFLTSDGYIQPFPGFYDAIKTLKKNGIYFYDVHMGNVGKRESGEYVFFDLGFSDSKDTSHATSVQIDHLMHLVNNY